MAYSLYIKVRKVALRWTKAKSHAWHDLLFIISLAIKNSIYDPNLSLILVVDTSAVETVSFILQWIPATCQLMVLKAKSHLLTTAQRRSTTVHREAIGTHHVMELSRPYLLQTPSAHNFLFVDASGISYISRVKPFNLVVPSAITQVYPSSTPLPLVETKKVRHFPL